MERQPNMVLSKVGLNPPNMQLRTSGRSFEILVGFHSQISVDGTLTGRLMPTNKNKAIAPYRVLFSFRVFSTDARELFNWPSTQLEQLYCFAKCDRLRER